MAHDVMACSHASLYRCCCPLQEATAAARASGRGRGLIEEDSDGGSDDEGDGGDGEEEATPSAAAAATPRPAPAAAAVQRPGDRSTIRLLPMHSLIAFEDQMAAFTPGGGGDTRTRVIIATNIAESSVTLPGESGEGEGSIAI